MASNKRDYGIYVFCPHCWFETTWNQYELLYADRSVVACSKCGGEFVVSSSLWVHGRDEQVLDSARKFATQMTGQANIKRFCYPKMPCEKHEDAVITQMDIMSEYMRKTCARDSGYFMWCTAEGEWHYYVPQRPTPFRGMLLEGILQDVKAYDFLKNRTS